MKRFSKRGSWATPTITLAVALLCACSGGGGGPTAPSPQACGPYPDPASSPYVLPYPVGTEFVVGQGNCTTRSHAVGSPDQYSYDFLMPIGTPITAVADGDVVGLEERFTDGNRTPGQENFVFIQHADGTRGTYFHLTRNGALVELGDRVVQGQTIGLSGDTGNSTAPHLHFGLVLGGQTVATTFRNTRPHPTGLVEGQSYRADPF